MKTIILGLFFLCTCIFSHANPARDTVKTALLIIDIQEFYFPRNNSKGLYMADSVSKVAKKVLANFRDNNQLVIHVQHQSTRGMEIHENVEPLEMEKVIIKTEINSFNGTDLLAFLTEYEIDRLILIGMQTHMCIEAACRAAYDFGFECLLIEDACTTKNLTYETMVVKATEVHASTLSTLESGGYAHIMSYETFKADLNRYLFKPLN